MIEATQQEFTYGDEGNIERTVRGKKDDFISHLEALYWPNALTCEKDRNAMFEIIKDLHVEFLRANQTLNDSIKVATKIIALAIRVQVTISYNKGVKRIVRAILVGRKSFTIPEIMDFMMRPPADAAVKANCIHMLSDMLAKIGRAAQRYSADHSGESMQIGDYAEVNAAMSSTGHEYSVTPGFTDQETFDAQIMDLCPDFDRSAYVTSEHSAIFAGSAPVHQKPKPTGNGGRGAMAEAVAEAVGEAVAEAAAAAGLPSRIGNI